jgi:hypothetical protein
MAVHKIHAVVVDPGAPRLITARDVLAARDPRVARIVRPAPAGRPSAAARSLPTRCAT